MSHEVKCLEDNQMVLKKSKHCSEKKKLEEKYFSQLEKDKVHNDIENAALKQDLDMEKRSHEEHVLQLDLQASESKAVIKSVKDEVIKAKRSYSEEYKYFGIKLKGLAEAADDYHVLLTENRKLYNEVQDLKGNIRVYCQIRPFLSGQSQKHTTVEFIGENGELIISNPLKQGNRNQYKKITKKNIIELSRIS
ncbi:unnamed protein product [Vicia faba]|uniref:Spindle pole body-associated protein Vik1/Cik1 microtubule binding domain-containing protein n=1 Tax=Vicia faba TaxID=3906 RepID=A0AAV1AJQ5_VICFA|nr:unnamed protein product [Vicia faba]